MKLTNTFALALGLALASTGASMASSQWYDADSNASPYGYRTQPRIPHSAPFDNHYDPTAPYGGRAAITAPPGTDAEKEQENNRRYFCEAVPERC